MYDQHPEFGHLVTDIVTHSRTMTESNATLRYDRSNFFSQNVHVDDVDIMPPASSGRVRCRICPTRSPTFCP